MSQKKQTTMHRERLDSLRRIEGQIRGIQKMIEDGRYCVDILIQIQAVTGAMASVSDKIFQKHLEGCVSQSMVGSSAVDKQAKIKEVINLIKKFKRGG